MNAAHVHLILNHIPVVGLGIGVLILIVARIKKQEELTQLSLKLFVVLALIAIPTYLTGEPAEEVVHHLPGVSHDIIEEHEAMAQVAAIATVLLGILSAVVLFQSRRSREIPSWIVTASLLLSLVSAGMMGWTANLGGQIRHTETRSDFQPPPPTNQGPETEEHENH